MKAFMVPEMKNNMLANNHYITMQYLDMKTLINALFPLVNTKFTENDLEKKKERGVSQRQQSTGLHFSLQC